MLLICFCFGICLNLFLYRLSDKLNHEPNGFIRLFPPHKVSPLNFRDLKFNSYYLGGATSKFIYLANKSAPDYLLMVNYNLSAPVAKRMRFPADAKIVDGQSLIYIDSPLITVTVGRLAKIFIGKLGDLQLNGTDHKPDIYFNAAFPVSYKSFILRVFKSENHESIFAKESFNPYNLNYAPEILEKQQDGVFSTDGMLSFSAGSQYLVYTYFYRNQFICLDTNLNVVYKARTIDTTTLAKIELVKILSRNAVTFSKPPILVNKISCINGQWILIRSMLRANNENKAQFDRCSVIDVYSLSDGKYHFSFYLPDLKGRKVTEFRVFNHMLIALYGDFIYSFLVNF